MTARVELWLRFNNKYRQALLIPFNEFQRFSSYPLAWLSHVAYTIYDTMGHISMSGGGPAVDCHAENIQPGIKYYYVAQNPRLLDPDLMEDRASFSTANTTRRGDFRQRVLDRDNTCILTGGDAENVQACHVVPYSKGDGYMANLINIRSEEIIDPPFDGISDTRNGIILRSLFHRGFEESRFAFLRTPNDFMTVDDVERVLQPNANLIHASSVAPEEKRLTFQHFDTNDPAVMIMAPHNCDAHVPDDAEWPPDLIFDAAYGVAAIKAWGTPAFKQFSQNSTKATYNEDNGGDENGRGDNTNGGNGGQRRPADDRNERAERAANREKRRHGGRQPSNAKQPLDSYDMLLGIWMFNAREDQRKADAVKVEMTKEKVQEWLNSAV